MLLRLARLSRLTRINRLLRGQNRRELVDDVLTHRGEYAAFISIMAALIVLVVCSVLVLQFESRAADANITTGGDALWWALVTITTVGYGDFSPVTGAGRVTGAIVMFAGVGIIGALASILASILVPQSKDEQVSTDPAITAYGGGAARPHQCGSDGTQTVAVGRRRRRCFLADGMSAGSHYPSRWCSSSRAMRWCGPS